LAYFALVQNALGVTLEDYKTAEQGKVEARQKAQMQLEVLDNQIATSMARLDEQQTQRKAKAIEVTDALRSGLEDIGAAALSGAESFKAAILDMIQQIALLSLRLYILKPLIEETFGQSGTTGGFLMRLLGLGGTGPASGNLGSLAGTGLTGDMMMAMGEASGGIAGKRGRIPVHRFARGGIGRAGSPQISIHNEGSMNEAYVPLPDGRRIPVQLRVPQLTEGQLNKGPMQVVFKHEINLTGSGDATMMRMVRQGSLEAYAAAVRDMKQQLPDMMYKAQRDKM